MTGDETQWNETTTESLQQPTDGLGGEPSSIDWTKAQEGARLLLEAMGEDPDEAPLPETWRRRVPAMLETLTAGFREEEKPTMRTFPTDNTDMVIKTGIPLYSLCEHHLLPYHGTVHVAYRPAGRAVGLSKLTRYVRWQSRRLTMQEQLTQDIAIGLADELETDVVLVDVTATHLCEAMRGVETATETTTRATIGPVSDTDTKQFRAAIDRTRDDP